MAFCWYKRLGVKAAFAAGVLLALSLVAEAKAPRQGLFAPRRESDEREPKQTYYQPRELQRMRPPQNAQPAADPTSLTPEEKSISAEQAAVGDPLASAKVALLVQEIEAAIDARQLGAEYSRWRGYMANRMDVSSAKNSGSEFAGNCRLKWYERMMRDPAIAPGEAEGFTRRLHQAVGSGSSGIAEVFRTAREKLDLPSRETATADGASSAEALDVLQQVLLNAQTNYSAALAPLSKSEVDELGSRSYAVFVGDNKVGHTLHDRSAGRRLCDLMEKMDRGAMLTAAENLLPLLTDEFRKKLEAIPDEGDLNVPGVTGRVLKRISTASGTILVGGREKNIYRLEQLTDVAAVVDLGGDDEYLDGAVSNQRPVLIIIDLKGNDAYRGTRPGIQGGAILGISLLLDWEGNDVYDAKDVAQASSIAGVGILIDNSGDDIYKAQRRVQAHALGGLGILIDRDGDDRYRCTMWGQGFGAPLGFGLLNDVAGDDSYFIGGLYPDSYEETPGLEGWGQGVGAGIRQVANGGIGVLLDGSGDDTYEFDYLSHGGGYWCGLGFLRDFAGNDKHLGSTEKSYGGGQRTQPVYQRFGNGWGCHFAMGFLFDDDGDDVYRGTIMGIGFGWDCSLGMLADFGGNDRYEGSNSTVQGNGAQGSVGILFDYDGKDTYTGRSQGYAAPSISYHPLPACGGNFSFLVDYGGEDVYGCQIDNNTVNQRGWAGGFVIDRPRADESSPNADVSTPVSKSASDNAPRPSTYQVMVKARE